MSSTPGGRHRSVSRGAYERTAMESRSSPSISTSTRSPSLMLQRPSWCVPHATTSPGMRVTYWLSPRDLLDDGVRHR